MILAAPPPTDPGGLLPPVDQDPAAVRDAACRIVSESKAVCAAPKPPTDFNPPSLDWVSWVAWILTAVVLLLVLYTVFVLLANSKWRAGRGGSRRKRRDRGDLPDEMEEGAVAVDRSREPVDWRAEAEAHRREGRIRDALRCRYRALVGDLARAGLIDEIPGHTTGEERAQLHTVNPAAATPFDAAADLFDDAWYGEADVVMRDDDRFQQLEHDVLASTRTSR